MGLGASKSVVPEVVPSAPSVDSSKKTKKQSKNDKWKKAAADFTAQLLDPVYLPHSLRGNSVTTASEYGRGSCEQPCLMPGTHKHLGGAYDPTDGCIYGVPAHSRAVLCLYPDDKDGGTYRMTTIPLPDHIVDVRYKFLRGIITHGYLWAIPSWADAVLCVDLDAFWGRRPASGDIVQLLPLPEDHPKGMPWQWHGAGINDEKTALYCIPASATAVLKVDIINKTTSLIPVDVDKAKYPNFRMDLNNKWYGGIIGKDNAVYGVPYRSCAVLRIDCKTDTAKLIGPDYGCAFFNWHGGVQVNGKIYAHPSHADAVLVINTNRETAEEDLISELPIQRAEYDTDKEETYKWLGGNVGADGNIYCPACDTSSILKIDTSTDICTTFGYTSTMKNKYQGGVYSARDKCIYSIPANGLHVLRIATDPEIEGEKPIQLIGDLPVSKDKWQGGHVGKDGCLYFIPENGYRVLKVTPSKAPPKIVNGKLPDNDVIVELM